MERIHTAFNRLRRAHRKALIPFVMGGDPAVASLGPLLLALQEAGADLLEVGIPFSDPLADGPTIQAASARALRRGATPAKILGAIAAIRTRLRVPILCLSYWNPILQYGGAATPSPDAFVRAAALAGVSGLIVPDVPVEEGERLRAAARRVHLAPVFLAAPTSPAPRLRRIARASEGFIYYVSVTGTTGARARLSPQLYDGVRQLKLITTKPVCVGFGVSTPPQARSVAAIADGVIIGSALIEAMADGRGRAQAIRRAAAFVSRMRRAV